MTIEALLTSIDDKLGQLLTRLAGTAAAPVTVTPSPVPADQAPAPAAAPAEATQKRGRGRPPKGETPVAPPAAPAVQSADDFLSTDEPPAEPMTLQRVRDALIAYGKRRNSPEKARQLLKDAGYDTLASLPESKWQAVYDAATKA